MRLIFVGEDGKAGLYGGNAPLLQGIRQAAGILPVGKLVVVQGIQSQLPAGFADAQAPYKGGAARNGIVISEGGAVFTLERLDKAKARGAKIYGELVGYNYNSDATDMVLPCAERQAECIRAALFGCLTDRHDVGDDGRELEDEVKVLLKHGAKVIAVRFENEDAPKIDGVIYTTVDALTSSLSQEVVRPIELKYEGGTVWYNCHEYDGGRVFLIHNFSKEDSFISFELSGELELFRIFEKTSEKAECGKKYLLKGKEAVVLFAE